MSKTHPCRPVTRLQSKSRIRLILQAHDTQTLSEKRIALSGVGYDTSWCAETLSLSTKSRRRQCGRKGDWSLLDIFTDRALPRDPPAGACEDLAEAAPASGVERMSRASQETIDRAAAGIQGVSGGPERDLCAQKRVTGSLPAGHMSNRHVYGRTYVRARSNWLMRLTSLWNSQIDREGFSPSVIMGFRTFTNLSPPPLSPCLPAV